MIQAGKGGAGDHWEDMPKLGGVFPRGKVLVFKLFCMLEIFHNDKFKKKKKQRWDAAERGWSPGSWGLASVAPSDHPLT